MKNDHRSAIGEFRRLAKQMQIVVDGLSMDPSLSRFNIHAAGEMVQCAVRMVEEEIVRTEPKQGGT